MKKSLLTVVALLSVSFLSAQEIKFGAKAGLNISTMDVNDASLTVQDGSKSLIGFHAGGFAEIKLTDKFALQPELLFSLQGSKFERNKTDVALLPGNGSVTTTSEFKTTLKTNYVNLPILVKFYATEKLFFVAGPQLGFLMSAKSETDQTVTVATISATNSTVVTNTNSDKDVKEFYKGLNVSFGLGGGYFFTENLFAEARYNIGLTNDDKSADSVSFGALAISTVEKRTNVFQVSVGYRF